MFIIRHQECWSWREIVWSIFCFTFVELLPTKSRFSCNHLVCYLLCFLFVHMFLPFLRNYTSGLFFYLSMVPWRLLLYHFRYFFFPQIPECRLEIAPYSWCDAKVNISGLVCWSFLLLDVNAVIAKIILLPYRIWELTWKILRYRV